MTLDLKTLQHNLPWTVPYSEQFEKEKSEHADMQHALIHIVKSAGIIAGMIDKADHGEQDAFHRMNLKARTADFVMCALRIANTAPGKPFDLEDAVLERMKMCNFVDIRFQHNHRSGCPCDACHKANVNYQHG